MAILTVGIDTSKNVFAVHGVDEQGRVELYYVTMLMPCWRQTCATGKPDSPSFNTPRI